VSDQLLNEASEIRATNEVKSEWAWWIAAILYVVGLGLTLTGRLFGVEVAPE
jgi:hypothetical protein